MKTEWTKEMCSSRPLEFEKLNKDTWIQRKDIEEGEVKEDGSAPGYVCLSRFISNDIKEQIDTIKDVVSEVTNPTGNNDGYDDGYKTGWDKGYTSGYEEGTSQLSEYEDGYQAAMILFGGAE